MGKLSKTYGDLDLVQIVQGQTSLTYLHLLQNISKFDDPSFFMTSNAHTHRKRLREGRLTVFMQL